jgi:hypothetical protein
MFAVDQDKSEKANWYDEVAKIADVPRRLSLVTCRPLQKRAVTMIDSDEQSHWRSRFARKEASALAHELPLETCVDRLDGDLRPPLDPLRVNAGSTRRQGIAANAELTGITEPAD